MSIHARGGNVGLALVAVGRPGALHSAGAVEPVGHLNEVSYWRSGLREWYANGPLGLEQGLELAKAPMRDRGRPVELAFALSGSLRPRLEDRGIAFADRGGRSILDYGGLRVADARGHNLPVALLLRGGRLIVRVEDAGAHYPLSVDPLVQAAELTASDGDAEDRFGDRVAVSGSTVVVGAPWATVGGDAEQGALYVFSESADGWANATQSAKLVASDGSGGDKLGMAVAIEGSTIVAGGGGAVYVFSRSAGGWKDGGQTAKLTVSGGTLSFPVGASVAIHGSTVVAGEPMYNGYRGIAYVFVEPAGGWSNVSQTAALSASDAAGADLFGVSVAVSASTVVVGSYCKIAARADQGAVYVFAEPPDGWVSATQTAKLTASDGAEDDFLGTGVAVSGSTIAGSASDAREGSNANQGAVYVFAEPPGGWADSTQTAKLTVAEGAPGELLGEENSLGISGSEIVAGAPGATGESTAGQGAVYVFAEPPGGWVSETEAAKLVTSDGDGVGRSVGVSGSTIVAGAPAATVAGDGSRGAAYVFSYGSSGSAEQAESEPEPAGAGTPTTGAGAGGETIGNSSPATAGKTSRIGVATRLSSHSAPVASASVAPLTPLFATRASLRGSTLGLLTGVVGIEGIAAGERIVLRCTAGCAHAVKDAVRVGRGPHPYVRMTIAPPLVIGKRTTIELEGLQTGRLTRFVQYRFRRIRRGTVVAYAIRTGCLAAGKTSQSCPSAPL